PEGSDTRPTTDRNREALSSMILSACGLDLEGLRVLDVFCGSGAVGLELLSRGAERATFIERSRKVARLVQDNISALGAQGRCIVLAGDAFKLAAGATFDHAPFDIVFLDPPYALEASRITDLVETLMKRGLLSSNALIVYERASDRDGLVLDGARIISSKTYGNTSFDMHSRGGRNAQA
ncbi:MAG: 16S rRNA (guanine(966)-N(2))-methyltransferase RsmD, partial [Atopobiaceae bacterium]|nr:16S rRNA (guanine(966)-N(2))-methyltransferase RsmD [Atopobiaceae bacterium]